MCSEPEAGLTRGVRTVPAQGSPGVPVKPLWAHIHTQRALRWPGMCPLVPFLPHQLSPTYLPHTRAHQWELCTCEHPVGPGAEPSVPCAQQVAGGGHAGWVQWGSVVCFCPCRGPAGHSFWDPQRPAPSRAGETAGLGRGSALDGKALWRLAPWVSVGGRAGGSSVFRPPWAWCGVESPRGSPRLCPSPISLATSLPGYPGLDTTS